MRLITWNVAWSKKQTLEQIGERLSPLRPDVVVICEAREPTDPSGGYEWIGRDPIPSPWPGLAAYARNGYRVERADVAAGIPRYMLPLTVHGPVLFNLLAAWPNKVDASKFHTVLTRGLDAYASWIRGAPSILAGDLNSSPKVKETQATHASFVEQAAKLGLVSAYHEIGGHPHGQEPESTYLRNKAHDHAQGWHLDYCFVSESLLAGTRAVVGDRETWRPHSDHLPLIVDIPDANFTRARA